MKRQPYPQNEEEWYKYETQRLISEWLTALMFLLLMGIGWWVLSEWVNPLEARVEYLEQHINQIERIVPVAPIPTPTPKPFL